MLLIDPIVTKNALLIINTYVLIILLGYCWGGALGGRTFANGPRDLGSILGHVIPKTLKMALDTSLINTQQYKLRIKGKVEQSRERSSTLLYTSV